MATASFCLKDPFGSNACCVKAMLIVEDRMEAVAVDDNEKIRGLYPTKE